MNKRTQFAQNLSTCLLLLLLSPLITLAQPLMETGPGDLPNEWTDKNTHHKVIRLCRMEGKSGSFYFHNKPFAGEDMVFYNTGKVNDTIE